VVVPTRNRAAYLKVALESLAAQDAPYEVVVVDDASSDDTAMVASGAGASVLRLGGARGLNAARNAGIEATSAPLIAFIDDDVRLPPTWVRALIDGAARWPHADAFGGPIRAVLEGPAPRACGREKPPITSLDLGPQDIETEVVWGANMAIRRDAFTRVGRFDEAIGGHGDEEDWLLRLRAAGGRIVYLAAAGLEHRRAGNDARLRALTRAAYRRGRAAGASDRRRGIEPSLRSELRVLAGCTVHTLRYRCPQGIIMGAQAAGRIATALRSRGA
jgi:GT2 family glycosyltransferase